MATVYLGLGANIGNREANLRTALRAATRMCRVTAASSLYETEPIGDLEQPPFYNAAAAIETGLEPLSLLRFLKAIEEEIGRRPGGPPKGPRPIDLDILLYDDLTLETPLLTVPHPRLAGRAFVLQPLAEIAGRVRHPVTGRTITQLAKAAGTKGVRVIAAPGWDGVAGRDPGRVRI
jgi:2-amino-4-hydroxy-6-hydroxymethyldihydropteridine diphosphokinase